MVFVSSCDKDETKNKDQQELKQLFTKIKALAESSTCNNESYELKFTGYGERGCGGPVGFLAYSTSIDVIEFEKLVADYKALEIAYNKKWTIVSTCDLILAPKSVTCENGKPKLVY
ncbi:hypothetical protein SAMN06297358_0112 [Pedobacter xixiisoli]|uniref:Uncharacterized protein n=2 Tax=Pedobacter xixiisoli TaxID=1476464 RepID=A0A285ZNY5_9SPHI|nr:hypothetical protein SAMN06297358_0112 [Pedobacter xixiisoli]